MIQENEDKDDGIPSPMLVSNRHRDTGDEIIVILKYYMVKLGFVLMNDEIGIWQRNNKMVYLSLNNGSWYMKTQNRKTVITGPHSVTNALKRAWMHTIEHASVWKHI